MMNRNQEKIEMLLSLLTDEQQKMDIVEITKENGKVFSFLEGQGDFSVSFSSKERDFDFLSESNGNVFLWRKDRSSEKWKIDMYWIRFILRASMGEK